MMFKLQGLNKYEYEENVIINTPNHNMIINKTNLKKFVRKFNEFSQENPNNHFCRITYSATNNKEVYKGPIYEEDEYWGKQAIYPGLILSLKICVWLPDSPIVYHGLANILRYSLRQFFQIPLSCVLRENSISFFINTYAVYQYNLIKEIV